MVKPDLHAPESMRTVCSRHYLLIYSLSTLVTDSYCIVSDTGIGSSLGKRSALGPYISGCLESVRQYLQKFDAMTRIHKSNGDAPR